MKKPIKYLIIGLIVLTIPGWFSMCSFMNEEVESQINLRPQVEEVLGIKVGSPYVDGTEVISFQSVNSSGIAYEIGLRKNDILKSHSIGTFARDLYEQQGKPFTFTILRNDQEIELTIPEVPTFNK